MLLINCYIRNKFCLNQCQPESRKKKKKKKEKKREVNIAINNYILHNFYITTASYIYISYVLHNCYITTADKTLEPPNNMHCVD